MTENEKLLRRIILDLLGRLGSDIICPSGYGLKPSYPCKIYCSDCWEEALDKFLESGQEK
jgi:hypothetical protein